jgi:hypothetical protein
MIKPSLFRVVCSKECIGSGKLRQFAPNTSVGGPSIGIQKRRDAVGSGLNTHPNDIQFIKICCFQENSGCNCEHSVLYSVQSDESQPSNDSDSRLMPIAPINYNQRSRTPLNTSSFGEFEFDDEDNEFTNSLFDSMAPFIFPNPKENGGGLEFFVKFKKFV